jgi:hypothetical protein
MAHWDIRGRLMGCEAANGKRYLQGKDDEFWENGRPSWCPIICALPEGHGRLVDADEFLKRAIGTKCFDEDDSRMLHGLVGESIIIVPADTAERSEA